MVTGWILNDLPVDGEYTAVAKLTVYVLGFLVCLDLLKLVIMCWDRFSFRQEQIITKQERSDIRLELKAIAEIIKGYTTLAQHHGEKSIIAASTVAASLREVSRRVEQGTKEVKDSIEHSAEVIVEKLSGSGLSSDSIPKPPELWTK